MKTYEAILNEVGNAVDYVRAQGGVVPDKTVEEQTMLGKRLANLPDSEILEDYYPDELPEVTHNVVTVRTVEEFRMIYTALAYIHRPVALADEVIDFGIWHESAHKQAGEEAVGARNSLFALTIIQSRIAPKLGGGYGNQYGVRPSTFTLAPARNVTKLAVASIVAAPPTLSDADTARLQAMRYRDQDDVEQRIRGATTAELRSLPLPKSAR